MTLQRIPGTDKALLHDVLRSLSAELVEKVTGKDQSHLYKVSHPTARLGLHLSDGAALDAALIRQGYSGVFIDWAVAHRDRVLINLGGPRLHDPIDPLLRLTELVKGVGDVADELRAAVDAQGVAGTDIVQRETDRLRAVINETRMTLDKLDRDILAHTRDDPPPGRLRSVG